MDEGGLGMGVWYLDDSVDLSWSPCHFQAIQLLQRGFRDTFPRNTFFDIPEDDADLPEGPATCPPASDGWWPSSSSSRLGSDTLKESCVWFFFLPPFW